MLKIEATITSYFSIILVASLILGIVYQPLSSFISPYLFFILMLVIYISFLTVNYHILLQEMFNWKAVVGLTVFTLILLPTAFFWLAKLLEDIFEWKVEWALGILLLFASPAPALAPTLAMLLSGHFERVLCTVVTTSILAPVTIPFLFYIYANTSIDLNYANMTLSLIKLIIIPLIAAIITNRFIPKIKPHIENHCKCLSVILLCMVVTGAVDGITDFMANHLSTTIEAILISFGFMLLAFLTGWYLNFKKNTLKDRSTVAILATWSNLALSIVLAKQFFETHLFYVVLFVVLAEIPWCLSFIAAQLFLKRTSPHDIVEETR
ncbi:bile acid:sodium symporter family protein [Zooshikella harenae]|uniref:Bile acid:sodium symporter n=1 Tax=Zooshikella harenae TaxID=2827238 RepID=A0ABS5Z7A1_9GAMM|nr:hypothetical protein [Zooshikella harenae]MBU2709638.1 hypothetical protein [Zooshikella harenae]